MGFGYGRRLNPSSVTYLKSDLNNLMKLRETEVEIMIPTLSMK